MQKAQSLMHIFLLKLNYNFLKQENYTKFDIVYVEVVSAFTITLMMILF